MTWWRVLCRLRVLLMMGVLFCCGAGFLIRRRMYPSPLRDDPAFNVSFTRHPVTTPGTATRPSTPVCVCVVPVSATGGRWRVVCSLVRCEQEFPATSEYFPNSDPFYFDSGGFKSLDFRVKVWGWVLNGENLTSVWGDQAENWTTGRVITRREKRRDMRPRGRKFVTEKIHFFYIFIFISHHRLIIPNSRNSHGEI